MIAWRAMPAIWLWDETRGAGSPAVGPLPSSSSSRRGTGGGTKARVVFFGCSVSNCWGELGHGSGGGRPSWTTASFGAGPADAGGSTPR